MAGDEVRGFDIVGSPDRLVGKAQMALRDAEGLLCVVLKVGLAELLRVSADDVDRVLVRADGAVAAAISRSSAAATIDADRPVRSL